MSCVADAAAAPAVRGAASPRVLVAGATGFAGALAAHLLWRHPRFELVGVTGRSEVGRRLDELYPRYRVPLEIEAARPRRATARLDAAIVAYPHAAAAPTVAALRERGVRVVDLSADFRLRSLATYEQWYGAHPRPELLGEAVYGLTELHRERIAARGHRRQPRLLPDGLACSALAPLARAGLIADVVIDAKQGISGAGRAFDEHDAPVDGRREHPPLQGRRTPPHAGDRGAARAAARRAGRDAGGAVPGAPRAARPGRAGRAAT